MHLDLKLGVPYKPELIRKKLKCKCGTVNRAESADEKSETKELMAIQAPVPEGAKRADDLDGAHRLTQATYELASNHCLLRFSGLPVS